ncbi:MAG: UDP-N-acetylmuramoyl-L-alanine--D-glutamate ligase [bacterium]|nr:UDP-N-acetylmuramoyl-L-alanine--D-glutamate ligase [bacterium]
MSTDFQGKRVTVMGLGLYEKGTGIEAVKFFLRAGARVTVTDLRSAKELEKSVKELVKYYSRLPKYVIASEAKQSHDMVQRSPHRLTAPRDDGGGRKLTFILGKHREEDFKNADVVFQNPSVPADSPYLRIAGKQKVPIVNDWSLFLSKYTPKLFIGVTGTRGKSTTTALIFDMMKRQYKKVWLAGNSGVSPLSFIDEYKGEPIVAELSSWLLHHFPKVKKSPNIAVVTNIMNDHLDKYRSVREYIEDKEHIFRFQDQKGVLVLNYDNAITCGMAKRARGKVVWSSARKHIPRWVSLEALQILGEHNRENALASAIAAEIAGVTRRDIAAVLKTFRGLPNRLEMVRAVGGVRYYNDTTATTPDATIAALKTIGVAAERLRQDARSRTLLQKPGIVLIAGGADKKLEYRELTKYVKQYCKAVVLLPGSGTVKITREFKIQNLPAGKAGLKCKIIDTKTMGDAVKKAHALVQEGDIVLLSPGAASFGLFKNEFDRGDQFVAQVKKL